MNMRLNSDGTVNFNATLFALVRKKDFTEISNHNIIHTVKIRVLFTQESFIYNNTTNFKTHTHGTYA